MEVLQKLKNFDAYPKTLEDFRVRTTSGAVVSLVAGLFIFWLFISELILYLTVSVKPELYVDVTRGEKLRINMDVTFHNLPCGFLSVDAMDISGEHQLDVDHNIFKKRIDQYGQPLMSGPTRHEELGQSAIQVVPKDLPADYCGSCYGAGMEENQCCNTCDAVQDAYRKRGWTANPEIFEQCKREGWTEKMLEQVGEGCQVYGYLLVNKVAGNFHFAPGKSFQQHHMHVHDLQPYKNMKWNISHTINRLSFGREFPGIINPLDNVKKHSDDPEHAMAMYQYFIKVVPTVYESLGGNLLNTNQFSVTEYFKPLKGEQGHGLPGVFFMYDLSPITIKYTESHQSFAHFLTGVCAIIGGVFTVAGIIDSMIYHSLKSLKKKIDLGKAS